MKKVFLILLAVMFIAGLCFVACAPAEEEEEELPPQPQTLIVGLARDTDGESLTVFEQLTAGPVYREFIEYVNNDLGGVHLSAYDTDTEECWVDLEADVREISVADWDVAEVTGGICDDIQAGTVHFLWGAPGTDCIYSQAPKANSYGTVLLTFEGGATAIANDPLKLASWPYVFITLSYSDWYQLPVLSTMISKKLGLPAGQKPKAYVVHIWGEHGDEYLAISNANFDVVGDAQIPFDPTAYYAVADEVMDAAIAALGDPDTPNYDVFIFAAYPDHVFATTGTMMAKKFNPPAIIMGPGANFPFYAYMWPSPPTANPALAEGIMCYATATYAKTNADIKAVFDRLAARIDDDAGDPMSGLPGMPGIIQLDLWGTPCYWSALQMWLAAVENVGYVDQSKLKDALADFQNNPIKTIMADETWFRMYGAHGGGNLDYLCHPGEIGQFQSGTCEIVGYDGITSVLPNYKVTASFKYPMTNQWGWLP